MSSLNMDIFNNEFYDDITGLLCLNSTSLYNLSNSTSMIISNNIFNPLCQKDLQKDVTLTLTYDNSDEHMLTYNITFIYNDEDILFRYILSNGVMNLNVCEYTTRNIIYSFELCKYIFDKNNKPTIINEMKNEEVFSNELLLSQYKHKLLDTNKLLPLINMSIDVNIIIDYKDENVPYYEYVYDKISDIYKIYKKY